MSQLNTGPTPTQPPPARPSTDIYSVLLMIATLLLAIGTICVAVRSYQLFGSLFPR